jgi:hypothetical protein
MNQGDEVRVLDEGGNICARGKYYGQGIPTADIKVVHKNHRHYAILVEGALMYYPVGYFTLMSA